jgi:hypothetical protein
MPVASQLHRLLRRSQDSLPESQQGVSFQVVRDQRWTPVIGDPEQRIEKFFARLPRMEDDLVQEQDRSIRQ